MLKTAILFQLFVVASTFIWFIASKRRSGLDLAIKFFAIAVLLAGLCLGSVWVYPPYWGLALLAFILLAVAIWKYRKPARETSRLRSLISNTPIPFITLLGVVIGSLGLQGHGQNPDGQFINLASPFSPDVKACVLSGGLNSLVNQHNFESDRKEDYGQLYGIDVMGFRADGFRVRRGFTLNPKPMDYNAYVIYGESLFSPCDGTVVWVENKRPEQNIGGSDKKQTSGNGVILACEGVHVKLAHMQKGSVQVSLGDVVKIGQPLGRVGNSGNTEEPHLHFHAETIVEAGNPWVHGEPVHMRFNGKLMARGDCF